MRQKVTAAQRRGAQILLGGAFSLLLALILLAIWCGQAAHEGAAMERGLAQEQLDLTDLVSIVQQAETAQRGYLLLGEPRYLAPYYNAVPQVPQVLARLGARRDIAALRVQVEAKMRELAATLALDKAGKRDAALAMVRSDDGLNRMQSIRAFAAAVLNDIARRRGAIRAQTARNTLLFQVTAMLCLIAAAGLAFAVLRGHWRQAQMLLDLNDELNRIFTLSADILAVVDGRGELLSLSPAWAQVTGRRAGAGTGVKLQDVVHPDDLPVLRAAFAPAAGPADALPREAELRLRRLDGREVRVAWRAVQLPEAGYFYAIGRDVTDERAREEQLRQSQKMEVIGQLTGGIAHDFNNLLTIILGSLELLQRGPAGLDPRAAQRIEAALEGGRRAASLTQRLLAFARRQPLDPKVLEVNRLVTGMSEILHRLLGEPVVLNLLCAAGLWKVRADGHQLENAILNLAVNARDAMPGGGHLTIETQNAFLDEDYARAAGDVRPGHYVMIAVTDTGMGMPPEVAAQVFEPFFTTKPAGQGTGLGLAQVYGFIKQSEGHVKIYSEPGEGTTVKLYLPRLQADAGGPEADAPAEPAAEAGGTGCGGGETVLIVEDEPGVRIFAAEALREYGYEVLCAENAAAALPIIESDQPIHLLFTDVVLSGAMNGRALAEAFVMRRGAVPVLFTTGYTRNAIVHDGRLDENIAFLGKPFTAAALARQVRKLLGNG